MNDKTTMPLYQQIIIGLFLLVLIVLLFGCSSSATSYTFCMNDCGKIYGNCTISRPDYIEITNCNETIKKDCFDECKGIK